jgi:two-component system alkaline phosphatase synthesis response regulator PhoP
MSEPLALIIEDEPYIAEIIATVLASAGFKTEVAHDGAQALAKLAEMTPTLVILDLHLPEVSGQEILQQIRATEQLAGIKVIVVTADLQRADLVRGQADQVLTKPFRVAELRELVERLRSP